jgi:small subunit ribosomal protein S9
MSAKRKATTKIIQTKAKKKKAVARATLFYPGKGVVRINGYLPETFTNNKYLYMLIQEPLILAGEIREKVDIYVNVRGGGFMGQAMAVRGAIAKALAQLIGDDLKKKYLAYDRTLIVDDVRQVEPKKPLGRKARAKKQTSYR